MLSRVYRAKRVFQLCVEFPMCIKIIGLSVIKSAIADLTSVGKYFIQCHFPSLCFSLLLPGAILSVLCWGN